VVKVVVVKVVVVKVEDYTLRHDIPTCTYPHHLSVMDVIQRWKF
jgi:hypothetical protein